MIQQSSLQIVSSNCSIIGQMNTNFQSFKPILFSSVKFSFSLFTHYLKKKIVINNGRENLLRQIHAHQCASTGCGEERMCYSKRRRTVTVLRLCYELRLFLWEQTVKTEVYVQSE